MKGCELAAQFGVSPGHISLIVNRKNWQHVAEEVA